MKTIFHLSTQVSCFLGEFRINLTTTEGSSVP